jgi:two-component system NarL family sensor kinase
MFSLFSFTRHPVAGSNLSSPIKILLSNSTNLTLKTAVKDLCSDINETGALLVNYQSIEMEHVAIDQTTAITMYRIVRELTNNVMKHAAAMNCIVQLSKTDNKITITVEDDGNGFDTKCLDMAKGIGWTNIQNRIEFLRGRVDINRVREKGRAC